MWNKAKCILLETKENSGLLLGLSKFGKLISYDTKYVNLDNDAYNVKQHLYIINDDVIKVNDWYLVELFKVTGESIGLQLEQCKSINDVWVNNSNVTLTRHIENCKKIIATTDKSLKIGHNYGSIEYNGEIVDCNDYLPQIPQWFIEHYITEYNKGKIISDVLVEYEGIEWLDKPLEYFPKINSDNTINTKTVKNSFSRSELILILNKFGSKVYGEYTRNETMEDFTYNWIEQNL